jgi:hypothetical protein
VIRFGKRNNKIRFLCKSCNKSFSLDFSHSKLNNFELLTNHLDGISLRKLSDNKKYPSSTNIFVRINPLIKKLPSCLQLTKTYCDVNKFSGKLVFDGTYVSVHGYDNKIPMIWGFDYDSHDCPSSMLVPSENYVACVVYFSDIKHIEYKLKYLVCDDSTAIKMAAKYVFPDVVIQTCLKHYLDNLRKILNVKTSDKYLKFFLDIKSAIYDKRLSEPELVFEIVKLFEIYKNNKTQYDILTDIMNKRKELTNYHMFENCPNTTNLIEGFNGHLKDRLKSIRGFKSFHSANLWLNAYVLRRRTTKFKACNKKFRHLNGKTPVENTLKIGEEIPNVFK